ncbi:MAG: hypothetical protein DCF20_05725 [Pseudanabaena sp.]|nr:MAG: hypothetical protein DCF20_05725 [Pseudanabaena sp.]
MAIVLSLQENIDLLLFLVKLAIALSSIAIALLLIFWLRLKKIENRLNQKRRQLNSRFIQGKIKKNAQKVFPKTQRSLVSTQVIANNSMGNLAASSNRFPQTQFYVSNSSPKLFKKPAKRSSRLRLHWLWAIGIAIITGMAIALMQMGNSFIMPEYMPIIWVLIGVTLVMSATFIKTA